MKMTVSRWESVQNECFTDEPNSTTFRDEMHKSLCRLIDERCFAKYRYQVVAIRLTKPVEEMVNQALERADARKTVQP